jgi:hypothetical protein
MVRNPYACEECGGSGEVECDCCGSEVECDACAGTGLDDEKLDVHAFKMAELALMAEGAAAGSWSSWAWLDETGAYIGRRNATRTLAYADFRRAE